MATTGSITGSSIDVNSLVSQLMQVESKPLAKLQQKETAYQAKISAYGTLLGSMTSLKTAVAALKNSSTGMSASVSDTSYLSASASSSALAGTYNINIKQLAKAQSLYSGSFAATTSAVADLSVVATQKMKIQVGSGTAKEITIDSTNNTLSGIRDAINAAGVGATASIINTGFVVDGSNNTILFNDGSDRTATLTAGTYTAEGLAAELKRAMEAANGSTDTYAVSFDTNTNKFSIANNAGNSNPVDLLWENVATTAAGLFGFTTADHAQLAVGDTSTADSDVGGQRLVLNATNTGVANQIKIQVDEDNNGTYEEAGAETDASGLSRLAYNTSAGVASLSQVQAAQDAVIKVNGLELSRSTNSISDVISGVTLTLASYDANYATTPKNITVTVGQDSSSLSSNLNAFVTAYNGVMAAVRQLRGNASSPGVLQGDGALLSLKNSLSSVTTMKLSSSGSDNSLIALGITHDKNGIMSLDSSKLSAALTKDSSSVISMINTMASAFYTTVNYQVTTGIPAGKTGYENIVKSIQKDEANMSRRLSLTQQALQKKFIALDSVLTRLQGTSNSITQQVAQWNKSS